MNIEFSDHQKEKNAKRKEIPTLLIKFQNLSHFCTCFAPQLENYIEGTRIDVENVDKKELKINFNRFKRLSSIAYLKFYELDAIINFKYPRFSFLCWTVKILFYFFIIFQKIFRLSFCFCGFLISMIFGTIYWS